MRKVLEEEERRKEKVDEKAAHSSASSAPKRTRKKRKKRRLPRWLVVTTLRGLGSALALRCSMPARHHGRYVPEGQLCAPRLFWQWLVQGWFCWLLWTSFLCFFSDDRPKMLDIMAGLDQKDSDAVGWFCWFHAVFLPVVCRPAARSASWSLRIRRTSSQLLGFSLRPLVSGSHLFYLVLACGVLYVFRLGEDFRKCRIQSPCCAGRRGDVQFLDIVVDMPGVGGAEIDELRGVIFLGPCAQAHGQGTMSTETWLSIIRCRTVWRHGETRRHNRTSEPPPPPQPHPTPQPSPQPHNNHTTTTQQPHNNHTTTQQPQPHTNTTTTTTPQPHNRTTAQPLPLPLPPAPPPPPPTRHLHSSVAFVVASLQTLAVSPWLNATAAASGVPRRRRERRLRAALRHEQQTVAMVLSAALHHSAQVGADVLYAAPRSQKTDRTAGRRPGVPKEPEPPWVLEHAVCPCSGAPLLGVPSLADPSAEASDRRTLRFLLTKALALQKKEEDEERRKVEE